MMTMVLGALLIAGGVVYAYGEKPMQNVSARKHPNLAAAQKLATEAWDRTVAAQRANEFDMSGHAQKAKELLEQASSELKLAAEAANENK